MTLLNTLLNLTNFRSRFLQTLIPSVAAAYGIQAAVAAPSILAGSERYYDFSGSITYITCVALSLYLPTIRARAAASLSGQALPRWPSLVASLTGNGAGVNAWNWRQVVLSVAVAIWAARLGSFLVSRIFSENGKDSRFEKIRNSPPVFFGAFMAQATWVSLCLLPVLAVNSLPATLFATLPAGVVLTDILGLALYTGGIVFEATADAQKSKWSAEKKAKQHDEQFLTSGLWSKSRHPNYFGECTLWTGIASASAGVLVTKPALAAIGLAPGLLGKTAAVAMAGVSPAFVTFLLFKVSGIPLSENKYDKKFKDNAKYQKWKKETPMFFPKL